MTQLSHSPASLAELYSRILAPVVVLVVVLVLASSQSGLGWLSAGFVVLVGSVLPWLMHRLASRLENPQGIGGLVSFVSPVVLVAGTLLSYVLDVPGPVPATLLSLLIGNALLLLVRRALKVSAHVSVVTFGVLWIARVYSPAWTVLLVLSAVMFVSRVRLGEHTRSEALAGALLGLLTFGCFAVAETWR